MQEVICDLLNRSEYRSPKSATDYELRRALAEEVAEWKTHVALAFLTKSVDASCNYVETVYGHTPAAHKHYIALYTVCMLYADDLGDHDPGAVMQFTRRFVRAEPQPHAVFECLADLLRRAHELWPQFGADCVITGTLDALAANHVECMTRGMSVKPHATRYPAYLRLRAGIGAPFTHFVFPNCWRETPESYVQILPLSFYKEELAGETNNYIHLRAAAEQTSTDTILRKLVEEVTDTARRVVKIAADDEELSRIWNRYMQPGSLLWNTMNVSFTSSTLTNSTVVDSATSQLLFELSTPFGLHYKTILKNAQNNVIGEFKQGSLHDEVTYQGRTMRVSEWLPKKSLLSRFVQSAEPLLVKQQQSAHCFFNVSSSRTFEAPNGRSYRWDTGGIWKGGWRLFDCQTEELVASGHNKKLFSTKMNIDVVQDGLPILDVIVLSFAICELMRKREEDVTVNATTYMNA
ncbi:hypothetical protein TRAPUB_13076 [Trametes pubescens]|uniref:DUF6593 domain-containing protein n=1 Tax=Trametes pubescens TaxID=154538 RepID=A0A1M2VRZ9_TRAPU|nr:hypothetical protein TRAPUB_13076 [Trametes pubescens]